MTYILKALIAFCAIGSLRGSPQEQNLSSLEYAVIPPEGEISIASTERTTILFSGFFLPSTAPPTVPTTLLTDHPDQIETTILDDGQTKDGERREEEQVVNRTLPSIPEEVMKKEANNHTESGGNQDRIIKNLLTYQTQILDQSSQETDTYKVHTLNQTKHNTFSTEQKTDNAVLQLNHTKEKSPSLNNQNHRKPYIQLPSVQEIIMRKQKSESTNKPTVKDLHSTVKVLQETDKKDAEAKGYKKQAKKEIKIDKVNREMEQAYHLERDRLVDDHPCRRDCRSTSLMHCKYKFIAEWYESQSKACHNCPHNITDCYREDCIPTDGMQRPLVVVNKKMPGPSIEVCLGDSVEIELENGLMAETTTIHWHGLHQRESPYMDGVPYVSQCPILPRSTFVYRYIAANTGTHFWHSHAGTQRADGMFGSLIVRSGEDPHRDLYDEDLSEHTIQILDWTHQLTIAVFTGHHHATLDNKPPTLLVNGRGVYGHMFDQAMPPASFTVEQGKRYRFRLINAGVLNCPIELSIDNHTLIAISSDGSDIAPVEVESIVSYAGERWDFVLNADAPVDNYWMRFRGLMDCDERFTSAHTVSVLHYSNSSNILPSAPIGYELGRRNQRVLNPLNEKQDETSINANELSSLIPIDRSLKPTPDRRVILSFDFHPKDNTHLYKKGSYGFHEVSNKREKVLTPQLNHVSLVLPPFPLLSQHSDLKKGMLCSQQNLSNCSKEYCECINVIELNLGEVVELVLIDIGVPYDANHPFHLHGHAFRVVGMDRVGNRTSVDEVLSLESQGLIKRNLVDPPLKDTVTVPDGGYTIVRFIADNPGYWMLHCHLEFHVELGMAVIFRVGLHSDFPPPPPGFPKCGNYISPPVGNDNEVYWALNDTKTSDTSYTSTNWWSLRRKTNNSSSLVVSRLILLLFLGFVLFLR